jgi:hypothetical protein
VPHAQLLPVRRLACCREQPLDGHLQGRETLSANDRKPIGFVLHRAIKPLGRRRGSKHGFSYEVMRYIHLSLHLYINTSTYQCMYPSINTSIHQHTHPSTHHPSTHSSINTLIHQHINPSTHQSNNASVHRAQEHLLRRRRGGQVQQAFGRGEVHLSPRDVHHRDQRRDLRHPRVRLPGFAFSVIAPLRGCSLLIITVRLRQGGCMREGVPVRRRQGECECKRKREGAGL